MHSKKIVSAVKHHIIICLFLQSWRKWYQFLLHNSTNKLYFSHFKSTFYIEKTI
jgi:hypothetical protein